MSEKDYRSDRDQLFCAPFVFLAPRGWFVSRFFNVSALLFVKFRLFGSSNQSKSLIFLTLLGEVFVYSAETLICVALKFNSGC